MTLPKDRPANAPEVTKGTRTRTVPVEVWLGDGVNPGLIDMDPDTRAEILAEANWASNPWGPPEWTQEDERRWRLQNSR